jgi:hypothetical protein
MYSKEKIFKVLDEIASDSLGIKPYVVICQPRRDLNETPAQNFNGHVIHVDLCGYSHGFGNVGGEKVDVARNVLIDQAIDSGAKYLFFVGEDTVIPYDAFRILHKTAEENPDVMVVGVYYIKISAPMVSVVKEDYIVPANVDPGQVFEILGSGLDCALIPIKLLKEMRDKDPDIPFCCIAVNGQGWTPSNPETTPDIVPFIGEDNFFYERFKKAGYRVLCNTDVQCLHMDLATGKYTAHPSVKDNMEAYITNIPITEELTYKDRKFIEERYVRPLMKKPEIDKETINE